MRLFRSPVAWVLPALAFGLATRSAGALATGESPSIPWLTWTEARAAMPATGTRPVYLYLGSELSELSRETERQVFGREETARWLAGHFACVRLDETAEPPIAAFVKDLVERVRSQRGPPYHVWLTPQMEPFEATGYLPPTEEWSQPGFLKTARSALDVWQSGRAAAVARDLRERAQPERPASRLPAVDQLLERGTRAWIAAADREHGGFGDAPKEPHPEVIRFLLQRGPEARSLALQASAAVTDGALQDPSDGGFFRRTLDEAWREPYRQKTLVDQARIAIALLEAAEYAERPEWVHAAHRALRFALTRLRRPEGGFYAALDATEGAPAPGTVGIASLGSQGLLLGVLIRSGAPFQPEATALAADLRAALPPTSGRPSERSSRTVPSSPADWLGIAFGLAQSHDASDRRVAEELSRAALDLHLDYRSGLCWAVPAEAAAVLPWRPIAAPSPIRAESLALALDPREADRDSLRRALQHAIEYDPLPPADILAALAHRAGNPP